MERKFLAPLTSGFDPPPSNYRLPDRDSLSSASRYCYSDFPRRESDPYLPRHQDTKAYLDDYANHFRLRPHIRLNRKVTRLQKAADYAHTGRWTLTTVDAKSKGSSFGSCIVRKAAIDGPVSLPVR